MKEGIEKVVFGGDEELQQEAIAKWINQGMWSKLLGLWVQGLQVNWEQLHGELQARPVSLPTYPFIKERHWVNTTAAGQLTAKSVATTALHPLLHINTSDLNEQRYSSTFTGEEFFLAEHQISGRRLLPAVAYLEMIREAVGRAVARSSNGRELQARTFSMRSIVWLRPVVVGPESFEVHIGLFPEQRGEIAFEIYSCSSASETNEIAGSDSEHEIIHCQGFAVLSDQLAAPRLDVEQLQRRMKKGKLETDRIYAFYALKGLVYGPAFQGITTIHQGGDQALACLRLPSAIAQTSGEYLLHPSIMDSALQAATGLVDGWTEISAQPLLPFALESLRIFAPCTPDMFAWARFSPGSQAGDKIVKLDIDLCDERGNVCVQMHGFSSRASSDETKIATSGQALGTSVSTPVWQSNVEKSIDASKAPYTEHYVILCGLSQVSVGELAVLLQHSHCVFLQTEKENDIAQRYSEYALDCFERIQTILRGKPKGRMFV